MAKFARAIRIQGYDASANPDWQMVPNGGTRFVILRDGAGLTVTSKNAGVCGVVEVQIADVPPDDRQPFEKGDRFFKLTSKSKGTSLIEASSGGAAVVTLEAAVKEKKTVKVKLNLVQDNATHKTGRKETDIINAFNVAKWLYREQTNINLQKVGSGWVTVAQNLGDCVRFSKHLAGVAAAEHEWDVVIAKGDAGADLNIFFVWEYEQDITPHVDHTNAGTLPGNCIIEDDLGDGGRLWRTMSHETGHHLGEPDHYNDTLKHELMYGRSDGGIHITKAVANRINP